MEFFLPFLNGWGLFGTAGVNPCEKDESDSVYVVAPINPMNPIHIIRWLRGGLIRPSPTRPRHNTTVCKTYEPNWP
jgi:hypothetical protein